ncbi:N-acetylgalactosamine-6-sulfatase [Haloferula helveola]|uniref:N-acetylgalactosamine-6-sulfatase n=1 Tax=Haloferula helveola TaxID=490095 RepID=A0ABM7R978_9BACT|nr:N-acetylgalactosamine-6-sulfatase [Haloferula helveola]
MRTTVLLLIIFALRLHAASPNIVLIITDDQGYGDLGCTGNPVIKTPHVDALAAESVWLDDYHVAPTCSPTRASLMTGHWTNRTGVWHTIAGRSMLRVDQVTVADMLRKSGYITGMFGKWHLGDNYPFRPQDRGFDEVYCHGGGGVSQTPDYWDNAYFDGHYFHNGKAVPAKGFCTDVFFDAASDFIRSSVKEGKPFFTYLATNAPHGPLHAPQEEIDRYKDQNEALATFYAMITNIDTNVGKLRKLLDELKVTDNTIFIYTTDNGTAGGAKVFNAGMKGQKGSEYDGGHRVPFFMHWPNGGLKEKRVIDTICHASDIAPTLLELTGSSKPDSVKFDGSSLAPLLKQKEGIDWPDRILVTDSQRVRDPIKWRKSAVMTQRWRLVNGKELYDITADPGQKEDVADRYPEETKRLQDFYEKWWADLEPGFATYAESVFGHPDHPEILLTCHDWVTDGMSPWNHTHIRRGPVEKSGRFEGYWATRVEEAGRYRISLRRWPVEADHPIRGSLPPGKDVPGASKAWRAVPGKALDITKATLQIDGKALETKPVGDEDTEAVFEVELKAGSQKFAPYFELADGKQVGAYFATITKL